jgi:hypothetical protein
MPPRGHARIRPARQFRGGKLRRPAGNNPPGRARSRATQRARGDWRRYALAWAGVARPPNSGRKSRMKRPCLEPHRNPATVGAVVGTNFVSFHRGVTHSGILFFLFIARESSRRAYDRRSWLTDVSQLGGAPCRFLARPGCGVRRCVGPTRAGGKKGDSPGRTTPGVTYPCAPHQTQSSRDGRSPRRFVSCRIALTNSAEE